MAGENHQEHLSDYERAIFYYTIPHVTKPVTVRVVAFYSALLLVSFGVLVFGVRAERDVLITWGAIVLGIVIVIGIVAFLFHAFVNQLAEDKALKAAKNIPDADSKFDDIPDPFSDHVLLSVSRHSDGKRFNVVDKKGVLKFVLPNGRTSSTVRVDNADGEEVLSLATGGGLGFTFDRGTPSRVVVNKAGVVIGQVRRKANFGPEKVEVSMSDEAVTPLEIVGGGIFEGDTMVGRVYEVRSSVYLDVQQGYFNDGLLAYFLLMA